MAVLQNTDVYALARSERGAQALMGLIPEAFQGTEDVVAGVQCRALVEEEQARYASASTRRSSLHPRAPNAFRV